VRIHAEEFEHAGGVQLATSLGAASADHLMQITDKDILALQHSRTVATLLPGTTFFLGLKHYAPACDLLNAGVTVALASDYNPGSCMIENLQWIMQLACFQMNMPRTEILRAVTINAAQALDLLQTKGSLTIGKDADLLLLDTTDWQNLFYQPGRNLIHQVMIRGHWV
jgi:imidazolonepropionase